MKLNKKNSKISMQSKIYIYLCGFISVLLFLLWLFQVVFLDDFYRSVKTNQVKETGYEIARKLENYSIDDMVEDFDSISENSDYCIHIADFNGGIIYKNTSNSKTCGYIGNTDIEIKKQVITLYAEAIQNGGEVLYEIEPSMKQSPLRPYSEATEYMAYGKIAKRGNNEFLVLVNSRITLVNEIAETIHKQLFLISAIILLLAMIFAYLMAKQISAPIIQTNKAAKKMAEGHLDVPFASKGYKEIEELNETLNYAEKELGKVDKLRNELIANVSHDLRTPLTMIRGYAEVMRDIPGENTPENVQIIIDECQRLTILVNDILDLSKLQARANGLELNNFNITQKIETIINRFSTMLKNEDYKIQFDFEEEVIVNADEIKINQVIYNLLANAINYAGEDKQIHVRQIIKSDSVRIEVSDNGVGITEEELEYVWNRYYKLDKVHKRPQVGTGLGLAIVKNVLDMHEAKYGVNSKIQEGTTFYFELKK